MPPTSQAALSRLRLEVSLPAVPKDGESLVTSVWGAIDGVVTWTVVCIYTCRCRCMCGSNVLPICGVLQNDVRA